MSRDADRWQRVRRVFQATLERPETDRTRFLREVCADDSDLRREVESLLDADATAPERFMGSPAIEDLGASAAGEFIHATTESAVLAVGSSIGPYEIVALLGAGGMGDVYRARDTRLKRDVAIKVLPDLFARDGERLNRFRHEAQLLASLNHPHIAAIYGVEESAGHRCLVLELVDGPTLSDRVARATSRSKPSGLPVADALSIAQQIGEALEAAHDKGIVHRDLKPSNVAFTPDGQVKVLDFGLAKALAEDGQGDPANSPALSLAATNEGVILGTAAYMSPEQAKGEAVDRRSDLFAFGCVLYEMLTGLRAFGGETVTETLAAVLRGEPDWSRLPADTPLSVRRLLRRCLEKDRKRRLRDIAEARFQIEEALSEPAGSAAAIPLVAARHTRERIVWIGALIAVVTATALLATSLRKQIAPQEARLEINTPSSSSRALAVSPDGRKIVFPAQTEDGTRLWLRSLDSDVTRPLPGTEDGDFPFWSPDSRSVGYMTATNIKRIDVETGAVQQVANVNGAVGGTWGRDGTILVGGNLDPISRVPATGGTMVPVTPARQAGLKLFPQFLPDGKHFLYYVTLSPEEGVYVGQVNGAEPQRLLAATAPATYIDSGHLLFIRENTLFAQRLDLNRLTLIGKPFQVADRAIPGQGTWGTVSASGTSTVFAYRTGSLADFTNQFLWFDRTGQQVGSLGDKVLFPLRNPSMSLDGRHLAIMYTGENTGGNVDVWVMDTGRSVLRRVTSDPAGDDDAVWSPDGSRIIFSSERKGVFDLYQKSATGTGAEELVIASSQIKIPTDWSSDARYLLYQSLDPTSNWDLWALPLDGDRKPIPIAQTSGAEGNAQFSTDGKWVSYQSDESGRLEIYMQAFPGHGAKMQVSARGGVQPRWRRDGRELFYLTLDGRLMAVPIKVANDGHVDMGAAVQLFATHVTAISGINVRQEYVVSPDGQRFLIDTSLQPLSPIAVVLNWKPTP